MWEAQVRAFVRGMVKQAPGATTALVGPALIYADQVRPDREVWGSVVALGKPGRKHSSITMVELGTVAPSPPPALAALCATVWELREPTDIDRDEAARRRDALVRELTARLGKATPVSCDVALAEAIAATFPSPEARALVEQVRAEAGT